MGVAGSGARDGGSLSIGSAQNESNEPKSFAAGHRRRFIDMKTRFMIVILSGYLSQVETVALAQGVIWTHWNTASTNGRSASGTLGSIVVDYSGEVYSATTVGNTGVYYWSPGATFTNSVVNSLPDTSDVITLIGGVGITSTLTFSAPVTDLYMDILSLGAPGRSNAFVFNHTFSILSQGGDYWKPTGVNCSLTPSGNSLTGIEGSGCILFPGTITSLSWTISNYEPYAGFTIGMTAIPEPGTLAIMVLGSAVVFWGRRRLSA